MSEEILKIDPKEVFICYRGANEHPRAVTVGMELYYLLEKLNGVPCFFAPRVIPKGVDYKKFLPEYFESVKVVVVLLTKGFFTPNENSDEEIVFEELKNAFNDRRIKFFPILFDGFSNDDYYEAEKYFDARDINRIRHINGVLYEGPYGDKIEKAVSSIIALKNTPIEKDIYDELSAFKPEMEIKRSYDLGITNDLVVRYLKDPQSEEILCDLIEGDAGNYITYNAYYCLNVMYRRTKDYEKLDGIIKRYHSKFTDHPSANHLLVLYYLETGYTTNYEEILELAQSDASIFTDNAGFVHSFPYVVASLYENDVPEDKEKYLERWYQSALDTVNMVIDLSPEYAKYYCTKARILAMAKRFKEAEYFVNKAISLEDSTRSDYFLRILDYQYYKIMIKTDEKMYEMTRVKSMEEEYV